MEDVVSDIAQKSAPQTQTEKQDWLKWLHEYGAAKFLDAFLANVENVESECTKCHEKIYVDVLIGGGVPDWSTADGDFGCTDNGDHSPRKRP
jgi:hypothetical protein